jgi:hypothetical protein
MGAGVMQEARVPGLAGIGSASMSPRQLLLASLAAWGVAVAVAIACNAPLHGDEASYAVIARGDGDWLYRSRGVAALARLGMALGGSELAVRLGCIVLGFGAVVSTFLLGRAFGGDKVGAWSAAVVAGAHPFVLRAGELLGDVPAAAATLGAIAIIYTELSRMPRYRLALAAPLLAASLYLRYGNAIVIAIVALASLAFWWRNMIARPGPVLATAALLAALVAPFFAMSIAQTGSWNGLLELGGEIAGRTGSGLLSYLTDDPFVTYGALVTPLIAIGLYRARTRKHLYFASIAIAEVIAFGLTAHAEGRYVLVACALFVVLGVDALSRFTGRVALVVVGLAALSCPIMMAYRQGRVPHDEQRTGAAIASDAAGEPCVVIARAVPQLMWYAGCTGDKLVDGRPLDPLDPGRRWYAANAPGFPLDIARVATLTHATAVPIGPGAWRLVPLPSDGP